jgi:hypothetical protein
MRLKLADFAALALLATPAAAQDVQQFAAQGAAASVLLPVIVPKPAAPTLVKIPVRQPFPLLISVDSPSYRVGDRITLAVTAGQGCNLTVLDFMTSGQVRTLFPTPASDNAVGGILQSVLVAGRPSAVVLPASGPAGTEQIVAICSADAAPPMTWFSFTADRAAVMRDLAAAAARPAGATAVASATFTVKP